jgi:hypothetical protein
VNLGFAALYAAFAVVALWLLGEVLLQHRAPLAWRVLALAGFAGVAGGVVLGMVPLIGAGAAGFGAGQVMVTRAVKRADGWYWSLRGADGGVPGPLGRLPFLRAAEAPPASDEPAEPVGEVGPVEAAPAPQPVPVAEAPTQTWDPGYAYQEAGLYQMRPLDEDSDNYGVYTGAAAQAVREQYAGDPGYQQQYGYDPAYGQYAGYQEQYGYQQQPYQEGYAAYGYQEQYAYPQQQGYGQGYPEQYQEPYPQQPYPPQQYN